MLLSVSASLFAQSSTEGKDFWVALTLCAAPSTGLPEPFIAVSTKKNTTITITNPNSNWTGVSRQVAADAWVTFTTQDIPLEQWYPTSANSIANAVSQASQTHAFGLHVTTDEEVSIFAALRMTNSFDAANILPITVLQSEYYTQDYPPYIKPSDGEAISMFTILATENNTKVNITPKTTTYDNHAAGQTYSVTLNAGQTYYVISKTLTSLSGSHVVAEGGKKIAVFQGDIFTQIPGGKAARDCTYEQAMPVDYWGSKFVVTRSMQKDANRIRVTAMENGTDIKINGVQKTNINAGDTYEFEMCNSTLSLTAENIASAQYFSDAVYLESSCPVAVYSYDVSNGYKAGTTEMVDDRGDPSMVWISPLEQKINKITFGACGTNKTKKHFIDIVCLTADASLTKLWSTQRSNIPCTFTPITAKPEYSYARVFLVDDDVFTDKVFHLSNPHGVIAHVYGNGDDESYAYSVGSAAVKRGVDINGSVYIDGYRSNRDDESFCLNDTLSFNAQVGGDVVDKVDWNFGDGVTLYGGPVEIQHIYEAPGWYDVTAVIYAHKDCPETTYPAEPVSFSFYVARADTLEPVQASVCDGEAWDYDGRIYNHDTTVYVREDCKYVRIYQLHVGHRNDTVLSIVEHDEFRFTGHGYFNSSFDTLITESGVYVRTLKNSDGCDSVVTANIEIIPCLRITVDANINNGEPICGDESEFTIGYVKTRGNMSDPVLISTGIRAELTTNEDANGNTWFIASLEDIKPGAYHTAYIEVNDTLCGDTKRFPVSFEVYYPSSIFQQKWDDVLAVLNKRYNGGYDIIAYQWYLNGMPIVGATSSVYYVGPDDTLVDGGSYSVALTTNDGKTLMSCPKVIRLSDDAAAAPAVRKSAVLVAPGVLMLELPNGEKYYVR